MFWDYLYIYTYDDFIQIWKLLIKNIVNFNHNNSARQYKIKMKNYLIFIT